MRKIATLFGALIAANTYATALDSKWSSQWEVHVWDGGCTVSAWYDIESWESYYFRFVSALYKPERLDEDSVWAIANRMGFKPGEILFFINGPGTNDLIHEEFKKYPETISVAGTPALKIEGTLDSKDPNDYSLFVIREPTSMEILEAITKGESVDFQLLLANDEKRSFELKDGDSTFFNVSRAQFEACIQTMPSNKSLNADAGDAGAG